jgi:hypothetical protein
MHGDMELKGSRTVQTLLIDVFYSMSILVYYQVMQRHESLCCCGRHGHYRYYGERRGFVPLVAGFKVAKLGMLQLGAHYWPSIQRKP